MKLKAVLLISFICTNNVFALTFYQNNNDYVVRCTGDDGRTWSVDQRAMVNSAHGLKLCSDSKPSIGVARGGFKPVAPAVREQFKQLQNIRSR
jgi:hypothetical protein